MPPPTSSSNVPPKTSYDVFLSFRGADTRHNLISHLYAALSRKHVTTFIDDHGLDRGEEISPTLLKAIEESKISVIIFSENYASSKWCLDELVKIMECMKTMSRNVLPVFYHVDPSDVRKQTGSFGQAFGVVKEKFKGSMDRVQRWSTALTEAANLSGWDSNNYRLESELIEGVIDEIIKKLYATFYSISTDLVGIDSHIEQILLLLCIGSLDVRFIGIWGMGGIGKTTIAEAIFSRISDQFAGCCFLSNVREKSSKLGLIHLKRDMYSKLLGDEKLSIEMSHALPTFVVDRLRRKKVIVFLDDVNDSEQLEALAGNHVWFGPGSRVIVTGRDKEVLQCKVDEIYKVEGLNHNDSLRLLSMKAFKEKQPPNDYAKLSEMVVNYAQGVPLALKVLGSHLYKRSQKEWETMLNKLKQFPDSNIQKILEISYDELDQMEKDIFLDIACFFKGCEKDKIEDILEGCGFAAEWGILRLTEKCLVTIQNNRLEMHDLIQEMGLHIAKRKGSRLWNSQDICHMLMTDMGKKKVEGIFLDMSKTGKIRLNHATFSRMPMLRLLKFYRTWSSPRSQDAVFIVKSAESNCLEGLSNRLSLLHWEEYPCKSLCSNFFMENLVELNMPRSNIEQLWNDNEGPPKLRRLDLSKSVNLKRLPDLSSTTNLTSIELWGCESLLEIPSSVQKCKKLYSLNLDNCKELRSLPSLIQLESLSILSLACCPNLKMLPDIPRGVKDLSLHDSGLEEWPSSVPSLDNLTFFSVAFCKNLRSLPSLLQWKSLRDIDLSGCSNLKVLPEIPDLPWQVGILQGSRKDYCRFHFLNCVNLGWYARLNIMACAQQRIKEIASAKTRNYFAVALAGSKTPEWFSYQSLGCSITISLPTCSFNTMFLGFAFCAVLEFEFPLVISRNSHFYIACESRFENTNDDIRDDLSFSASSLETIPESDHVFLWYRFNSSDLNSWLIQNCCILRKASFEFKAQYRFLSNHHPSTEKWEVKVKRCGVHLIYNENVQNAIAGDKNQWQQVTETNSNNKRSRDDYCSNQTNIIADGGSGYAEEEPQAKRLNDFCSVREYSSNAQDGTDYEASFVPSSSSSESFPTFYQFL
ncbi:TMV resistance protein N, putative [Ricinus communis]|uniref:ADP-ribosyl cyclase/cyclic ADP-ribose hydrolase n=1 Tax=Ricinus communis TaxID=3988 RepID=B9SBV5_RICCO|nr:TMV resistance protein N, putative [Ricinus communis]